ncbi:Uncharacterised protein [Cedecea davisae]|nr:Uncharacterised protein [Cedecea davisae]
MTSISHQSGLPSASSLDSIKTMQIIDALCRVEQAQQVLSVWMEANISDSTTFHMMGALVSLLEGVPEAIEHFRVTGEPSL